MRRPNCNLPKPNDPEQSKLFIDKAREIDADEERSASSELMRLLTKSPSEPHQLKK